MRNFPIKINNSEYWISRSIAAAGFIFHKYNGTLFVLACKRGPNAADNQGKWNCPCGYLDYDETVAQCCAREVFEETAVCVDPDSLILLKVNDDPYDSNKQNVTFRYFLCIKHNHQIITSIYNSEPNEVDEAKWIPVTDIDNYEWAFGHRKIINEILSQFDEIDKINEMVIKWSDISSRF